jgi:carboxylesterase
VRRLELLPIAERVTSRHLLTTHRDTRARVERLVPEFFACGPELAQGAAGAP